MVSKWSFLFFRSFICLISFSFLILLASDSSTMLNTSGKVASFSCSRLGWECCWCLPVKRNTGCCSEINAMSTKYQSLSVLLIFYCFVLKYFLIYRNIAKTIQKTAVYPSSTFYILPHLLYILCLSERPQEI